MDIPSPSPSAMANARPASRRQSGRPGRIQRRHGRYAAALVLACAGACPTLANALTMTCYWVGQVHQTPIVDGVGGDPAFYTWGDALGWSLSPVSGNGSCLGGSPNNAGIDYDVVIAGATAPASMANLGQTSMVQVVANGQFIHPTIQSFQLSDSTLGIGNGSVTTGRLLATGSSVVGGTMIVNGSVGNSALGNMTVASTALSLTGPNTVDTLFGSLALARNKTTVGRTGGAVAWGVAPTLAVGAGTTLVFSNLNLYGQDAATASLGTISAAAGSMAQFLGVNNVLGTTLQGGFNALAASSTRFQQTANQGVLTALDGATVRFENGSMSQQAGATAAAPGFVQIGSAALTIVDLNATAGYFSGLVRIDGDGAGGGIYDNVLSGVTVKAGSTLTFGSGSSSFSGTNRGTLSVGNAALALTGSTANGGGALSNGSGGRLVLAGTLTNLAGASVDNAGLLQIEGGATLNNLDGTVGNHARAVVTNFGTVTNAKTFNNDPGASLVNNGLIENRGALVNAGTITGTGSFSQIAGASQIDGILKQVSISLAGGSLSGTGSVTGALTNTGGVLQGGDSGASGRLTINGHYMQGPQGILQAFVTGTGVGQYSVLSVSDGVDLDGELRLVTGNGFAFAAGQTFDIVRLSAGSVAGTFAQVIDGHASGSGNGLDLGGGLRMNVLYGTSGVELQVVAAAVPEPASASMMLLGAFVVGAVGWGQARRRDLGP